MVLFTLIALVVAGYGVFLLIRGIQANRLAGASRSWPSVTGKIEHSKVVEREDAEAWSYRPEVIYTYMVDGVHYRGEELVFGLERQRLSESGATEFVRRYPAGGSVQVFFDPDHPETAVIEHGSARYATRLLVGGILMLVLAALCGLVAWQAMPRTRAAESLGYVLENET